MKVKRVNISIAEMRRNANRDAKIEQISENVDELEKTIEEQNDIEDENGNKYRPIIIDGHYVLRMIEDSKGILYE